MGLRDRYQTGGAANTAAETRAAVAPATPASAPSSVALSTPEPAAPSQRDLAALRAELAGRIGGVNPPEASAAVTDTLLDPCTKETPDGGAEPLPNHPDAAKAGAAAGSAQPAPDAVSPSKRKRRTKAEMEAARAAAAASTTPTTQAAGPPAQSAAPEASAAAGSEPSAEVLAHGVDTPEYRRELAAAAAETAGFVILTAALEKRIASDAIDGYLCGLSLETAISLVRMRLPQGVKTLEIEA